jgi:fibro-slime domain-containing protein
MEGEHQIFVVVSDITPTDSDETNNVASIYISVQPGAEEPVDLSIGNEDVIISNASPTEGERVTITATIHGDVGTQSTWEKHGVVLDVGGAGETLNVVCPSVLKLADGSYAMYYSGEALSGYNYRIFRATSADGITWQKQGMVIDYGGAYAGACVYFPYVMLDDAGVFHMWYGGVNLEDGYRARTLYAYSTDGINFVKTGLDMNFGSASDPAGVHCPYVMNDNGQYRMWYQGTYWSPNFNRICHADKAALSDPWVKDGTVLSNNGIYDSLHAQRPWVLKTDGGYEMFYSGYDSVPVGRILHATSPDGMAWTKDGVVLAPTIPLEGTQVQYNSIIKENGTYKMWYSGYSGSNWRIFYAENAPAEPALDATCTVSFYLDSVAPSNLIGTQANVFVPANGQATASIEWTATVGNHTIVALVGDVVPADIDLSNNEASKAITVLVAPVSVIGHRVTGFVGQYYNLPSDHPDVGGEITGVVTGDSPFNHDWYDNGYFSFERTDSNLQFGIGFFPVDDGWPDDPQYFAVHWHAQINVDSDGTYAFEMGSDDDSWLYIDGVLVIDLGGVHAMVVDTGSVWLAAGEHELNIYFAERHIVDSGFYFEFLDSEVSVSSVISIDDIVTGVGETIQFDGSLCSDSNGVIESYEWNFGDGSESSEQNPQHSFDNPGTYVVTLTITDDCGAVGMDTCIVTVTSNAMPRPPFWRTILC